MSTTAARGTLERIKSSSNLMSADNELKFYIQNKSIIFDPMLPVCVCIKFGHQIYQEFLYNILISVRHQYLFSACLFQASNLHVATE